MGCYSGNSNILPYIEQFNFRMEWPESTRFLEIDQYTQDFISTSAYNLKGNFIQDNFTGVTYYPKLKILNVESQLHVNFVEHPISIPRAVPVLDTRTVKLARISTIANEQKTVEFRDIDLRRTPKYIMFYCSAVRDQFDGVRPQLFTDKSASIVSFKLHTDIQRRCLESDSVQYVDALTCRNFPGYTPPINLTGKL